MSSFNSPANIRGSADMRGPVERHIRDLQKAILGGGGGGGAEVVHARSHVAGANAISTTETVEISVTLAIPEDWNSYTIEAHLTGTMFESGAMGGARTIIHRLRLTNASGTILGTQSLWLNATPPSDVAPFAINGWLGGQTATGNVVVCYTAIINLDSGQASRRDVQIIAHAWRDT